MLYFSEHSEGCLKSVQGIVSCVIISSLAIHVNITFIKIWWTVNNPTNKMAMQLLLEVFSKLRFQYYANVSELINIYFSWNHPKTIGFLMISGVDRS